MATATMSVMGLYNYNPHMFDGMVLPDGVDRDTLVFNLVVECAEMEVLIPDPVWMAKTIEKWSQKEAPVWEKLLATTKLEYDPISNYDRKEEWTDENQSTGSSSGKVAAFNAGDLVEANGAETSVSNSSSHKGHTYGNIGVTTSQQMIEEERRVVQFNIYDYIIQSFQRRFCLLVY